MSPRPALARNLHSTTTATKLDGAVSTEGEQSGTTRSPSCEDGHNSLHTHPCGNRNNGHGALPGVGRYGADQRYNPESEIKIKRRTAMAQKVIDVVGTSKDSFAKAAENAVAEAAKTVRGLKWARVAQLEMELDGQKIAQYRTTTKIYFDIEH